MTDKRQLTDEQLHNLLFYQFLSDWTYWGGHKDKMFITTDPWSDKQLKLAFIQAIERATQQQEEP